MEALVVVPFDKEAILRKGLLQDIEVAFCCVVSNKASEKMSFKRIFRFFFSVAYTASRILDLEHPVSQGFQHSTKFLHFAHRSYLLSVYRKITVNRRSGDPLVSCLCDRYSLNVGNCSGVRLP